MALAELRDRLAGAFEQLRETSMMDETALNGCLNEITCALLDADLPRCLVNEMESKSQRIINLPPACNKGKLIYQIMLATLFSKLDPGKSALVQARIREPSIVMFIGLRGVEKTKMCAKYARYHLKKGFRPALVCADPFKTGAFLRLKTVPVYESYGTDPEITSSRGIAKFKKEDHDLIIVDTSDRHTEYSPLFEEMRCLAEAVNPDLVIFVMDSSIGQAAFDQAQAFKQSFAVGAVIVTNVNSASKACGAISAVAAAKCPMILAETGVKSEAFEAFEAEPFVRRLFKNPWLSPDYQSGYTLRKMYNYYRKELGLEKENVFSFVPSACSKLNHEKVRRYMTIMDSMTDQELDKSNVKSKERMMEIAEASKVDVKEVVQVMKTYKMKAKAFTELEERSREKPAKPYKLRFPQV